MPVYRPYDDELRKSISGNLGTFVRVPIEASGRKRAAVAVALMADPAGAACFVLTRRAPRMRAHAGQWALPGGRVDADESASEAALRELDEEVGLRRAPSAILGLLDDYATRSGYVITPVVVWCGELCEMTANPKEVAAAYRVPVSDLERPDLPHLRSIPESQRPVISLPLLDTHIHAPTAAVLFQFREVGLYGRGTRVAHFDQPVFAWK